MPNTKSHSDLEILLKRREFIKNEIQLLELAIISLELDNALHNHDFVVNSSKQILPN